MGHGKRHRSLGAALEPTHREPARFGLPDMPIEAIDRLAKAQNISGCQGIQRKLYLLAINDRTVCEGPRTRSLVVNDAHTAIGRYIDPIDESAKADAVAPVSDDQWEPTP